MAAELIQRSDRNGAFRKRFQLATVKNALHLRQFRCKRHYTIQIGRLADHHLGIGVGYLVAQKLALQGGIDRHANGAKLVDREPCHDGVDVVVQHRQYRFACLHT